MKTININSFLLLILLLHSCEKMVVDVNLPEQEPVIVLNAIIETDKPIIVNISKGIGILDTTKQAIIENAIVEIFENGNFKEKLTYTKDGNYISNLVLPQYGNKYKVIASAPGFKEVSAETSLPSHVTVSNIIIKDSVHFDANINLNGSNAVGSISFTLHDPMESNYYLLEMSYRDSLQSYPIYIDISDSQLESFNNMENPMFNDTYFNGKDFRIEVFFNSYYLNFQDYSTSGIPKPEVSFNISTINHEFYIYKKSVLKQFFSIGNPFAEPAPVYSNIKNGLGVFLGKNNNYIEIRK